MAGRWITWTAAGVASLVVVATVYAGGWVIVTVRHLPEYAVAGSPVELSFMAREHGLSPVGGLQPKVTARSESELVDDSTVSTMVVAPAVATKRTGEYTASLVFPHSGRWTVQIEAYNDSTLPSLTVIAPGRPAPPRLSKEVLGERLFVAKGCIGCHVNHEVEGTTLVGIGPELTGRRFPAAYLKGLLADPGTTFGQDSNRAFGSGMPDLDLTTSEIEALTAFINRERH